MVPTFLEIKDTQDKGRGQPRNGGLIRPEQGGMRKRNYLRCYCTGEGKMKDNRIVALR